MNLFKKIAIFFRKKRNENDDTPKRSKAKRRYPNTKQKSIKAKKKQGKVKQKPLKTKQKPGKIKQKQYKAKQKSKVFVPPSFQDPKIISNDQVKADLLKRPVKTTSKNSHKVRMPSQVKLVITGSVGAGKTTAIGCLSEKEPITTESKPSDEIALIKATTTTSMDYGTFHHSLKSKIHLYGTPGQKRFSFMGTILTEGASGLIILINNNQKQPLNDLNFYLKHNEDFLQSNHAAIGITHFDMNKTHSISEYTNFMEKMGMQWPVFPVDARKNSDVLMLIDMIIDATFRTEALEA
jgi:signal recognition particle receptor subunit beta